MQIFEGIAEDWHKTAEDEESVLYGKAQYTIPFTSYVKIIPPFIIKAFVICVQQKNICNTAYFDYKELTILFFIPLV